jgi:phage shock protein A
MSIFSRFSDIISANINSMLDRAEDPEKMIRMMIREMEDTLVEIKASCAGTMAQVAKSNRELSELQEKRDRWSERAELAVSRGKEDLAREALLEKRTVQHRIDVVQEEIDRLQEVIQNFKKDMGELEAKLEQARNKHKVLVQRHVRAQKSNQAQSQIRKVNTANSMMRFDKFEQRIERMEADADLVNYGVKADLDEHFASIETDDEIETELKALKEKRDRKA